MTNEKTNPDPPKGEQKTLRLTEYQGLAVALAQRIHHQLVGEGNALVQQGEAKRSEGTAILRAAVEGAFKEHKEQGAALEIPQAEIKIINDERGRPAVFVWSEVPKPETAETDEAVAEGDPAEEADEAPAAEKKPAPAAPAPANGKHPEAAKRKLPVK